MQHTKFRLAVNRHNLKLFYLVGAVTFYGQYRLYMKYKEDGGFKPSKICFYVLMTLDTGLKTIF